MAREGDLSCAFNATVYGANLKEVPAIVEWGREHIDIAHVLVFIAFRALTGDLRFDYFVGEKRIDEGKLVVLQADGRAHRHHGARHRRGDPHVRSGRSSPAPT